MSLFLVKKLYIIDFVYYILDALFIVMNSKFEKNFAYEEGGSIKWIGSSPFFKRLLFLNNNATYGNDVASHPIRMRLAFKEQSYITKLKIISFIKMVQRYLIQFKTIILFHSKIKQQEKS